MKVGHSDDYEVRDGIIVSPGKFEGEPEWVRHFWDEIVMHGLEDDTIWEGETPVAVIDIPEDDDEIRSGKFAKVLEDVHQVALWEDDQGFVRHEILAGD